MDQQILNNYWPISLISNFAKDLEEFIQFVALINFSQNQYDFRPGLGISVLQMYYIGKLNVFMNYDAFDNGIETITVVLDFSKAFKFWWCRS